MAAAATTYTLQKEDGSEVTAQEVYDALMSGPVFCNKDGMYLAPIYWAWSDINGTQDDPTNVGFVGIKTSEISNIIMVGDTSLAG